MLSAMDHCHAGGHQIFSGDSVLLGAVPVKATPGKQRRQPLFSRDRSMACLFDGVLHNTPMLEKRLIEHGISSGTLNEAEIVLKLYQINGRDFAAGLEGNFVFAIWHKGSLLIGRDRLGHKRLFYSFLNSQGTFIFSSEIKGLLQHPEISTEIDKDSMLEQRVLGYIWGPDSTLFKNIKQVAPGKMICLDISEEENTPSLEIRTLNAHPMACETRFPVDEVEIEGITQDLVCQLEEVCGSYFDDNQREVGVLLSGGIDSTVLAACCSKHSPGPIRTFSLSDVPDHLDLQFARNVSSALNSTHQEFIIGWEEFLSELPVFFTSFENVTLGGGFRGFNYHADFASFLLSKKVSAYADLAICGEGGDELFGGYAFQCDPDKFRDEILRTLSNLHPHSAGLAEKVSPWFSGAPSVDDSDGIHVISHDNDILRQVFDFLLRSSFTNFHLWAGDQGGVRHGLDIRLPYTHDRILDVIHNVPVNYRMHMQIPKYILKKIGYRMFGGNPLLVDVLFRKKLSLPSNFVTLSHKLWQHCELEITDSYMATHPFQLFLQTKVEVFLFDLFYYVMVRRRGTVDSGFTVSQLYREFRW